MCATNSCIEFVMLTSLSSYSIKRENVHILDGNARNKVEECAAYERKIRDVGGIDFMFMGTGPDG